MLIAQSVEDAIADVAMVFHWQPSAFDDMTFSELMEWREKARQRVEVES
ncbi:GpE family phage tail protein [Pasteurella multocida]